MSEAQPHPRQSFPLTQRELVGLALQRGARRPGAPADASAAPAPHQAQRDRVRLALQLGLGGGPKGTRPARRGIYR